jgi:hypothetical protein
MFFAVSTASVGRRGYPSISQRSLRISGEMGHFRGAFDDRSKQGIESNAPFPHLNPSNILMRGVGSRAANKVRTRFLSVDGRFISS